MGGLYGQAGHGRGRDPVQGSISDGDQEKDPSIKATDPPKVAGMAGVTGDAMAKRRPRIKTGRRACDDDRKRARELVELYRLAQASPDGRYCLNPGNDPCEQGFIDAANPDFLLSALEDFAKHGTFQHFDQLGIDNLEMRHSLQVLRAGGQTRESAIAALAEKYHTSESSIERRMRVRHGPLTVTWPVYCQNVAPIDGDKLA